MLSGLALLCHALSLTACTLQPTAITPDAEKFIGTRPSRKCGRYASSSITLYAGYTLLKRALILCVCIICEYCATGGVLTACASRPRVNELFCLRLSWWWRLAAPAICNLTTDHRICPSAEAKFSTIAVETFPPLPMCVNALLAEENSYCVCRLRLLLS